MPSPQQRLARIRALKAHLARLARRWACDVADCDGLPHAGWRHRHARASQRIPGWAWRVWIILAGRGWGKTKTGAETVREWALERPCRILVVAKTLTLCREICFESPTSGLLSVFTEDELASQGSAQKAGPAGKKRGYSTPAGLINMRLANGSEIFGFGSEVPDAIRGWAFDKTWLDEYAAMNRHKAQDVYDMAWFTMRESPSPQMIVTTTPKALPHVKLLVDRARRAQREEDEPSVVLTHGHTDENRANLSGAALAELEERYGGTRLGRQELSAEILEDVEGALWKQWMLDLEGFRPLVAPDLERLVIALDPAVTSSEDADLTAFVAIGRTWPTTPETADPSLALVTDTRPRGYVLRAEQHRLTPEKAMRHAASLYHDLRADYVVVEANNGGEYLPAVMRMVDPTVPVRTVNATRSKRARAAPAAALYEQGRMFHVGLPRNFADLETQMLTYVGVDDPDEKGEKSPDLLDALVWGATDLLLGRDVQAMQRVRDERLRGRR